MWRRKKRSERNDQKNSQKLTKCNEWTNENQNPFKDSYRRVWQTARETKDEKSERKSTLLFVSHVHIVSARLAFFCCLTVGTQHIHKHVQTLPYTHMCKDTNTYWYPRLTSSSSSWNIYLSAQSHNKTLLLSVTTRDGVWGLLTERTTGRDEAEARKWDEVKERYWKQGGLRDCKIWKYIACEKKISYGEGTEIEKKRHTTYTEIMQSELGNFNHKHATTSNFGIFWYCILCTGIDVHIEIYGFIYTCGHNLQCYLFYKLNIWKIKKKSWHNFEPSAEKYCIFSFMFKCILCCLSMVFPV